MTGTLARVIECLPTTACCYWLEMSVAFDVLWPIFCFHSVWQWQQQLRIKDCDSPGRLLVASTATVTLTGTMLCSHSELYLRPNLSETVFTCLESCFYIYISSRFLLIILFCKIMAIDQSGRLVFSLCSLELQSSATGVFNLQGATESESQFSLVYVLSTCLHKSICFCCFITIFNSTRLLFIAFYRPGKTVSSFAH